VLCLVWKFLKERQLAREENQLKSRGFKAFNEDEEPS